MKKRPNCAWMRFAALLLFWAEPFPCAAQLPELPSPLPPSAAPSAVDARQGPGAPHLPPVLPDGPPPPRAARAGASAASPLATNPQLRAAPFAPGDLRFPINLATALRLSDARPLIVAAAQARVWVAEAELTQAKVLWLPDA